MKRRDLVRTLLTPDAEPAGETGPAPARPIRVGSSAVRAMGLEIGRIAEEAREADNLRRQIADGDRVIDLDPAVVEPSFAADRLSRTADAEYRRLVDSMRESGQQVPILVRPHPDQPGKYQVAYGHRRREAAAELGRPVRSVVRVLSDAELVVAQGKENAERRNLSFIERALFAAALERQGFDRATLNAALAVHTAEMTRFLAIAAAIPIVIVRRIGPAPKAGRPRWMELAEHLAKPDMLAIAERVLERTSLRDASSDRRFAVVIDALREASAPSAPEALRNARGEPVIRIERTGRTMRLIVDERLAPGLGQYVRDRLGALIAAFERDEVDATGMDFGA